MRLSLLILMLCLSATYLRAQDFSRYERTVFITEGDTLPYRILFPESFNSSKKYPVIFFLHGRGESGSNNEDQLRNGGSLFLKPEFRTTYPCIVIAPQCPADSYWSNVKISTDTAGKRHFSFRKKGKPTKAMRMLLGLVDRILEKPFVDSSQIYAGGLSMGGMGTFELLRRKQGVFAAAFAICGGDDPSNVKKYDDVSLWIFHGGKDDIVAPEFSEDIVRKLRKRNADLKFSLYPEANHNSWDPAFAEPDLMSWLFSKKRITPMEKSE
ncbi:dienelactone hydrolase family protein [Arcticibacter pallidicorallinus]|nr:dienelactone hydrolase family protein [Arcticibacter pallidicorallinus]